MPKNYLKRSLKYLYLSFVFQNNHVFGLAGGNYSHKDLFRYYGMKEDRIFLMPMMVDNSKFYVEKKMFPKPFTFLFVGRLVSCKNVEHLIQQFNIIFSDKDAVLKIVGDGRQGEYLIEKYTSEKVIFKCKKFNKELITEYLSASCFVFPSLFEPWGLVVNEALSAGIPVIARKEVGACLDLINGKQTGFIAEDMPDFGQMMLTLFNDSELLYNYSKNASYLMKNNWNYKKYKLCMMKFINTLSK
jgi:glycosyltransferase involved in cell wall biosynthesis